MSGFSEAISDAVARQGVEAIAIKCKTSPATVRRWAEGESAPHRLGRPSVLAALSDEHVTYLPAEEFDELVRTLDVPDDAPGLLAALSKRDDSRNTQ